MVDGGCITSAHLYELIKQLQHGGLLISVQIGQESSQKNSNPNFEMKLPPTTKNIEILKTILLQCFGGTAGLDPGIAVRRVETLSTFTVGLVLHFRIIESNSATNIWRVLLFECQKQGHSENIAKLMLNSNRSRQ